MEQTQSGRDHSTPKRYGRDDLLRAKQAMLNELAEISGGKLLLGCCTQGCCDPGAQLLVCDPLFGGEIST
jgi:hypothetical protein